MASFGTTISSGIQDISAILSLFGTEQCELHVGSALRGAGRGGYLYAAITPVSIFGSLGAAKAAFTIMLISLPFGARILKYVGFEPKGDVVAAAMLESDSDRYLAETRVLQLLDKHYIRSAQDVSVAHPASTPRPVPLRPWDLSLLVASLVVACLGALPYVHFSVLHHTPFPALAIFFPLCRVTGGLLCVFPGQLLLQYRIQMIMKQRLLFKGVNDILKDNNIKIPVQHLLWDDSHSAEACLSSLVDFLGLRPTATRFVKQIARIPHFPPQSSAKQLADGIRAYLTNTWLWLALICALLLGFLMTIVGYIGCFTIVQSSTVPSDTYIWLGAEATLALIRLVVWGLNPSWDDSDGICLSPTESSPPPTVTPTWVVIDNKSFPMFKIMTETRFWQAMTAYSGPVDIGEAYARGSQRWYSWIKGEGAEIQLICIIVEGEETVLCRLDPTENMKFYHGDLKLKPGHVVQKEELKKDHELMKEETNFKLDVCRNFYFIIATKDRARDTVGPIKASWPLSESLVTRVEVNSSVPRPRDVEHGDDADRIGAWSQLVEIMDKRIAGSELEYKHISACRAIISNTTPSIDLHEPLSHYFSSYAKKIYDGAPKRDADLKNYYNDQWEIYSKGILYLDRLFGSLNYKVEHRDTVDMDAVVNVAVIRWKCHVLQKLETRLRQLMAGIEIDRVLALFLSEDWTMADFRNMTIKSKGDRSVLEEASAGGHTEIVRLILEAGLENGAQQYDRALQSASSSGHIAIVRLLLEKGADINAAGIPVLQTASRSGQLDVVQILLDSGADVNALGGKYYTALQAASCAGYINIVGLLLGAGADASMLGGKYGSALQGASFKGHLGIVRLLLNHGANINATRGELTALETASSKGHEETVDFLLQEGADIHVGGIKYGGALQAAAYKGQTGIIRLFLEKGADVNAKGGEYCTALQAASSHGKAETVRRLLASGADVNAVGGKYGSALQAATIGAPGTTPKAVVRLLLAAGANIKGGGGKYGSALQGAAYRDFYRIVRRLLEKGADINDKGGRYCTALQAASYGGQIPIVRLLLENGADVNIEGGEYCTALQAASFRGLEATVRPLLKAGADVNRLGGAYGSALQAASHQGHKKIVLLLLEAGADVKASGGKHGSALRAASHQGHDAISRLLLERGADPEMGPRAYS
ncbi:ankyrin repeat-containing domain protein [Mycena leptocephala]|nr:ankyrin repeat-containing domain protein [Mycena leptocephala]